MSSPCSSFESSSLRASFLVLEDWVSVIFLPLLRLHRWVLVSFLPRDETQLWSNSWFTTLLEPLSSSGRYFFAPRRFLDTTCIGFGFAIAEPSLEVLSCALFDMALRFLFERKKWLHESIERLMIFNKRRRWSFSSRVKLLWVTMSASWLLVSAFLIWILEFNLILTFGVSIFDLDLGIQFDSVKQTIKRNWVLDTCLTVGLLPLMIILITVLVSSNMYNWDPPWEECAFIVTWSTCDNWSTSRFSMCLGFIDHSAKRAYLKMSGFTPYWILGPLIFSMFLPHNEFWPFLGLPLLQDVRVLPHPKFWPILGRSPLFQLFKSTFLAEEEAHNLEFLPHPKFWPFFGLPSQRCPWIFKLLGRFRRHTQCPLSLVFLQQQRKTNNIVRVFLVKTSPAEGRRRFHQKTLLMNV